MIRYDQYGHLAIMIRENINKFIHFWTSRMMPTSASPFTWTQFPAAVGPAAYLTWSHPRVISSCLTCLTRCPMNKLTRKTRNVAKRIEKIHFLVCILAKKRWGFRSELCYIRTWFSKSKVDQWTFFKIILKRFDGKFPVDMFSSCNNWNCSADTRVTETVII